MDSRLKKMLVNLLVVVLFLALIPLQAVQAEPKTKPQAAFPDYKLKQQPTDEELAKTLLMEESIKNPVSPDALPSYTVELSQNEATRNDVVWITLRFDTYQDYQWATIELVHNDEVRTYDVELTRYSGTLFEGYFYVSNFTEPGYYSLSTLTLYGPDSTTSAYVDMWDALYVSGTIGEQYPALDIVFDQAVYYPGDVVGATVTPLAEGLEDFFSGAIYLSMETGSEDSIELTQMSDGTYYGEMRIGEYFPSGAVSIDSLEFWNYDGWETFYSTEFYEGTTSNYQDYYWNYFQIQGTSTDYDEPEFLGVSVSSTDIGNNDSVTFTVRASDATSGVERINVGIGESDLNLQERAPGVWVGEYRPDPFYPVYSPEEVWSIEISDFAGNYYWAEPGVDFDPISITIDRYPYVGEIYGSNRYETAIQVSRHFPDSERVILAKATDFPDALSAGPLSFTLNAPILLCKTDSISTATLNEIKRRGATEVIVMGGAGAISDNVINTVKNIGVSTVRRISGANRYGTAIQVAKELGTHVKEGWIDRVVIANGFDFPDALAAGSWASWRQIPILLNPTASLRADVKEYLLNNNIQYVSIIGGSGVLSDNLMAEIEALGLKVARTSGSNRYNTSVAIAKKFFLGSNRAIVTNGRNFADALTAAPLAAYRFAPLLLVNTDLFPSGVNAYLSDHTQSEIDFVTVIGGDGAVSDSVKRSINDVLSTRYSSEL